MGVWFYFGQCNRPYLHGYLEYRYFILHKRMEPPPRKEESSDDQVRLRAILDLNRCNKKKDLRAIKFQ